jgi:hypothetical protein
MAAAFRHRREARIRLECSGGGVACPLFAAGDEEARGKERTGAWPGGTHGAVGMARRAWRHDMVEVGDRVQDEPELGDERLDQEGLRGDHARIGRQRRRARDGLEACVDAVGVAHVMGVEEALQGGAARKLGGCEGGPVGEEVTEAGGGLVVTPWQGVREVVCQRTGEAGGQAHVVADQPAAMFDAWLERTHRGAWGGEGLECVAMRAQELTLEFGVRGVILRMTGRKGFAVRGQGARIDGEQHPELIFPEGRDERTLVACETHGEGVSCEPLLEGMCPRIDGLWCVFETTELPCVVANGWYADIVCGIGPIDAHAGGHPFLGWMRHRSPPGVCEREAWGRASWRSAKAVEGAGGAADPEGS